MMTHIRGFRGHARGLLRTTARMIAAALAATTMFAALWAGSVASASDFRAQSGMSASLSPARVKYYIVPAPGHGPADLYAIAAQTLGNGRRYMEIFNLNKGRLQPNGARLENPRSIDRGWILQLPADATGPGVHFGPLPVPAPSPTAPASGRPAKASAAAAAPRPGFEWVGVGVAIAFGVALIIFFAAGLVMVLRQRRRAGATGKGRPRRAAAPGSPAVAKTGRTGTKESGTGPAGPPWPVLDGDHPSGPMPAAGQPGQPIPAADHPSWPQPVADYPSWPQPAADQPSWPQPAVGISSWQPAGDHPSGPFPAADHPSGPMPVTNDPGWPQPGGARPGQPPGPGTPPVLPQRKPPPVLHHTQHWQTAAPSAPAPQIGIPAGYPRHTGAPGADPYGNVQRWSARMAGTAGAASHDEVAVDDTWHQVVLTETPTAGQEWGPGYGTTTGQEWGPGYGATAGQTRPFGRADAAGLIAPTLREAGEPRLADSVQLVKWILTDADDQAARIRQQAAALREAAEMEAAEIKQQAAAQATTLREAAEREAAELRAAVTSMSAELGQVAAYVTENLTLPAEPATTPLARSAARTAAWPATEPAARPPTKPTARPATKPAAKPATRPATKPGTRPATAPPARTRQFKAMRLTSVAVAALFLFSVVAGTTEIALHGFSFFVFRSAGTGATASNGLQEDQGPGQPNAPGTHHHLKTHHSKAHHSKAHHSKAHHSKAHHPKAHHPKAHHPKAHHHPKRHKP